MTQQLVFTESLSLKDQVRLVRIAHESGDREVREFALKLLRQCWPSPELRVVASGTERV